jgi:hypothetical protein
MLNLLLDFEEMGRLLRDRLQALAGTSEDGRTKRFSTRSSSRPA